MEQTLAVLEAFGNGLIESLMLHKSFMFVVLSSRIRNEMIHCAVFNLVLFVGSIMLADFIVFPIINRLLSMVLPDDRNDTVLGLMRICYQLLWLYPVYALSFIFNTVWYQNIARFAFAFRDRENLIAALKKQEGNLLEQFMRSVTEQIYSVVLLGSFLMQISAISVVPFIGQYLAAIYLSWLYSLYYFEYRWIQEGKTAEQRMVFFESRWAYFTGFGLPSVGLSLMFPKFISYGIFAFLFPFVRSCLFFLKYYI